MLSALFRQKSIPSGPVGASRDNWLTCEYLRQNKANKQAGHYESYFVRANHPTEAKAFWIRYTLFQPNKKAAKQFVPNRIAELWAIYFEGNNSFDGDNGMVVSCQKDIPWPSTSISDTDIHMDFNGATFNSMTPRSGRLCGGISNDTDSIQWDLTYSDGKDPLLFFDERLYSMPLPKAKSLVISPNSFFQGELAINGEKVCIDRWQGSVNHNWGSQHTDAYAWGQVAGFDNDRNAFLECATAQIKVGPFTSPALTLAVLCVNDKIYRFNKLIEAPKNEGTYNDVSWRLGCSHNNHQLDIKIEGDESHFATLQYKNPPGGFKTCLNSKIASCTATLYQDNQKIASLNTQNRAAFEILK